MSAARPPRSIRVGTIQPCLRERSPAILPAGLRPSGHDRLRGRWCGWRTPARQPGIPLNPPLPKGDFTPLEILLPRGVLPLLQREAGGAGGGFAVARSSLHTVSARRSPRRTGSAAIPNAWRVSILGTTRRLRHCTCVGRNFPVRSSLAGRTLARVHRRGQPCRPRRRTSLLRCSDFSRPYPDGLTPPHSGVREHCWTCARPASTRARTFRRASTGAYNVPLDTLGEHAEEIRATVTSRWC
jgi:hypothetical protein